MPPIEEYAQHFAHWSGERYALEATPTYSYGGRPVIQAIRSVLGRPKIVISLRDPADRLWSAYTFQRSVGNNVADRLVRAVPGGPRAASPRRHPAGAG